MDVTGDQQGLSSFSVAEGGVEVVTEAGSKENSDRVITIRDGKNPDGPKLVFTPDEWQAFVLGVKDGEFDLP
jgi:Domain of unknown function (DUF397)